MGFYLHHFVLMFIRLGGKLFYSLPVYLGLNTGVKTLLSRTLMFALCFLRSLSSTEKCILMGNSGLCWLVFPHGEVGRLDKWRRALLMLPPTLPRRSFDPSQNLCGKPLPLEVLPLKEKLHLQLILLTCKRLNHRVLLCPQSL